MLTEPSLIQGLVASFDALLTNYGATFKHITELIKLLGALVSFGVFWKLRKIEKRYLFRATAPGLIRKLNDSLSKLESWLNDQDANERLLSEALNHLLIDARSAKRRARGDSIEAADQLLATLKKIGVVHRFWGFAKPGPISKTSVIELFGKASGLVHALENEVEDAAWSDK
jgi:hypothetical protein